MGIPTRGGGEAHRLDHYTFRKIRKSQDSTDTKIKLYIIFILIFFSMMDIKRFRNWGGLTSGMGRGRYLFRKMRKSQEQYPY